MLFVDDEKQILNALKRSLRGEPYEMRFAESAETALDLLATEPVLLIVSDLNMPHTNGVELLEIVAERHPEVGRVLMSGNADLPSLVEALNKGQLIYYFEKPWSNDGLRLALGELVDRLDLEKNNRRLVETIRHQNETLIRQSEIQHRFFAMMSHEIRTPLNGIFGMLQVLDQNELAADNRKMLRTAMASAEHLRDIVNDVLDFSKIEAGEFELNQYPFGFRSFLTDILSSLRPLADEKQLELRLQAAEIPQGFHVMGDDLRLRQVLINLLGNAIKFTDSGSVTLNVVQCKDGGQLIEVADTGVGIPEQELPHLFEAYQQVISAGPREDGSGLGLSIARQLVKLMGGDLQVSSKEGQGTTFTVRLALPETEPVMKAASGEDEVRLAGCQFLVVDDNPTNRLIVRAMLEQLDAEVDEAASGEEAMESLTTAPKEYGLIFMDISMEGMDGIETLGLLRSGGLIAESTPVIAMSAHVQPEEQARFLSSGMAGFLGKPFNREDLLAAVQAHKILPPELAASERKLADLIDSTVFRALADSVGTEAMGAMVTSFETDAASREEKIVNHLAEENWQGVAAEAHALGSSAGMFGAMSLHQICRDVEAAFKTDELSALPALADQLCELIRPSLAAAAEQLD